MVGVTKVRAEGHLRRSVVLAFAAVLCAATSGAALDGALVAGHELVDLTHTLDAAFPFIPVPGVTFPFGLEPIATLEEHGVAANRWVVHEHLGTQVDAPNHFAAGGKGLHELTADELVIPAVVIDFRARAAESVDAELRVEDLRRWERRHGRVPAGSVVFLYTGWDTKIDDPEAYVGVDGDGVKHFPGIGREAAAFLVARRDVWGVGVDTISFDPGYDGDYRTHRVVLGAGKWALEAVANLRRLPPTGATVFVGAPKVRDATGGPVRILALVPRAPSLQDELEGRWRSAAPEPLERADGSVVYLRRDFRFEGDTWSIEFTVSTDAPGRSPLFTGRGSGRFSVGDYRALDKTHEVYFGFTRRRLTPLAPAVAETLNAEGCGSAAWRTGEEQDVTEEGCPAFRVPSRERCPGEYDLVRLTEGGLFLGARPRSGDLCSPGRRPGRPGSHALARADP